MMSTDARLPTPLIAAFRHHDAREGFEVVSVTVGPASVRVHGQTAAVEDGQPWSVRYVITLDQAWHTRHAEVWGLSATGERSVITEIDGSGRWRVNGDLRPDLAGCLDVDLESSACTNTIPVHRMGLSVGEEAEAPAVYIRAVDLTVERLEQTYRRLPSDDGRQRYDYRAPVFDFEGRLVYDEAGLLLDYPGIASRAY
jgi:uncharacterized protein